MMENSTKICSRCGIAKPRTIEFFHKKLDGFAPQCKECRTSVRREQYPEHKDAWNQKRRINRLSNPEHFRHLDNQRYLRDREKRKVVSARARAKRNPQEIKAWSRAYYEKNKTKIVAQSMAWAKANPVRRAEIMKNIGIRKRSDVGFRLRQAISAYVNWSLRGNKNGRRWETLVGFDLCQLKKHLERQFTRGMSWANYGNEWHIDHIIPASSFKYSSADDEEFKQCWALTNLRPLWAEENIRKRDRRTHLI